MKTKFTIALALGLFFCSQLFSQSVCRTQLLNYTGPKNSTELSTKLSTSTNPLISNLSSEVKSALVALTVFENDFPRGIDGDNTALENFIQSTGAESVLTAIFNSPVIVRSYENKPSYPTMLLSTFMALYNSNPTDYAFTNGLTMCYNCYFGKKDTCCYTGGKGCWDFATEIISTGARYYIIQD